MISVYVLASLEASTKIATGIAIRTNTNGLIIQRLPTRLAKLAKRSRPQFYDKSRIALFHTVVPLRWSPAKQMTIWPKVWGFRWLPNIEMTQLMAGETGSCNEGCSKLPYHSNAPKIPNGLGLPLMNPTDTPQKQFRRRLPASSSRWHLDCVVHDTSLDISFAIMNSNFFFWIN